MRVNDIQGSSSRALTNQRQASYSNMDYRDVTDVDFKTKRHTNPLNPTYKVRDEDNKVVHAGPILGNQPKTIP